MFPYSCDALLYHLPIATGVMIGLNILAFIGVASGTLDAENGYWLLEYGTGLHPIQWLLSPFMHAGIEHLLGNMVFLWTFGLVTEGKLGWWRFTAAYLGIAVGQSAIEQAVFPLFAPEDIGYSLGASAAIFGLVAMACIWAPINQLSIFMLLFFRPIFFEMSVGFFAALYVGLDLVYCIVWGSGAIGSATHLMGAAMGAIVGVVLLKTDVVECEDYDLFSVLSGTYGSEKQRKREAATAAPEVQAERRADKAQETRRRFEAFLQIDQPQQALVTLQRARMLKLPLELDRKQLLALIAGLQKQKLWVESAPLMAELLSRFPEGSQAVRLKLAQVCVVELDKPGKALEILDGLNGQPLTPQLVAARDKVRAFASRKVEEGAVEIDDAGW